MILKRAMLEYLYVIVSNVTSHCARICISLFFLFAGLVPSLASVVTSSLQFYGSHNTPGMTVVPWYDPNGNITQVVHTVQIEAGPPLVFSSSYEYDFDNRLVAVDSPLLVAQYSYDGLGNLLQIVETGTVRRIVRDRADPLTRPLALTDGAGAAVQTYLWANGSLVAQVEANGAIHYAHFNELGHLLALTDENGAVTDQFAYHPYGRLVARTGTTDTPFAYMGAHGVMRAGYDLYLTRHRAYSANLMRFMQTDPLGLDGGLNLYAYAGGNPVFFVDVLGLARMSPELAFAPRSDNLMSEAEYRAYQSQQQQAQTFLRALGANASSPQLAQQVSLDLVTALPGAAVGGLVDDAVRGIVGAVRGGSVVAGAARNPPSTLYHYTSKEAADNIARQGLMPGRDGFSYLTSQGGLSPIQAQIELALPVNRSLPNAVLKIDAQGLSRAGINPALGPRQVQGNLPGFGAGGGTELLFDQKIPAQFIQRIP